MAADEPEELTIPITFINNTGMNIYHLYADGYPEDSYAYTHGYRAKYARGGVGDILRIHMLEHGKAVRIDFTYESNITCWCFGVEDDELQYLDFGDFINFNNYDINADGITITLNADGTTDVAIGADDCELLEDGIEP